jgi:hypothetical protein
MCNATLVAVMHRTLPIILGLAGVTALPAGAEGPSLIDLAGAKTRGEVVKFRGEIDGPRDISGAVVVGDFLLIVSDEVKRPTALQVLKKDGASYEVVGNVELPAGNDEVDLEAVAAEGRTVFVTGSHAWTRKIENGDIGVPKQKVSREQFFRFELEADGTAGPVAGPKSMTPAIEADPVLKGFVGMASKENGIDIESLAVQDGRLHFGFRGPVLRGGLVPVLSAAWDDPAGSAEVRYVRLDGRGIRDMVAVDGGFLLLAGPVGDADFSYRIYFWDGADQRSVEEDGPRAQRLAELADIGQGKPEALAVLKAKNRTYELLLLCDGVPKGGPMRFKLTRP